VSVCPFPAPPPQISFRFLEPVFMNLGMYILATEPITTAFSIYVVTQSISLLCIRPSAYRLRLSGNVTTATNTRKNRRIIAGVLFYSVRDISNESGRLRLEYIHCSPESRKRRQKRESTGLKWDSKMWSWVLRDLNRRVTANCMSKLPRRASRLTIGSKISWTCSGTSDTTANQVAGGITGSPCS
jgi:hypothetical protein